jgi:hypothetical protein
MSPLNSPRHMMATLFLALPLLFLGTRADGQQTSQTPEKVIAKSSQTAACFTIGELLLRSTFVRYRERSAASIKVFTVLASSG